MIKFDYHRNDITYFARLEPAIQATAHDGRR